MIQAGAKGARSTAIRCGPPQGLSLQGQRLNASLRRRFTQQRVLPLQAGPSSLLVPSPLVVRAPSAAALVKGIRSVVKIVATRVTTGDVRRKKHSFWLRLAKGFHGTRRRQYKQARGAVVKAHTHAYKARRMRRRLFRQLWVQRLHAVSHMYGKTYPDLIHELRMKQVLLNRAVLSNLAIYDSP